VSTIKGINQGRPSSVDIFNAKFSILHPGTSIRPHCGPSNARLRLHLTIQDAGRAAWIRVGRQNKTWAPGGVLIFDDSFEHEVKNSGNISRVVLILDFWHPQLPASERIYV
jgi:aspartate beta-hydroxylase